MIRTHRTLILAVTLCVTCSVPAFGQRRGGGGPGARPGGGMGARPGGGMARPGGGMARPMPHPQAGRPGPSARPNMPNLAQARPNPGFNRPGPNPGGMARPTPQPRPNPGFTPGGNRPGLAANRPANRPAIPGDLSRPGLRPGGNRPGPAGGNRPNFPAIAQRPGAGGLSRPTTLPAGIGNRPGTPGNRPGAGGGGIAGNRPGFPGNRPGLPGNRPGIGGGGIADNRPGYPGNRPGAGGGGVQWPRPGDGGFPGIRPGAGGGGVQWQRPGGGFPGIRPGGGGVVAWNRPWENANRPGIGNIINNRPAIGGGIGNFFGNNINNITNVHNTNIGQIGNNLGVINRPNYGNNAFVGGGRGWGGGWGRPGGGWFGGGGGWSGYNAWRPPVYQNYGNWYRGSWGNNFVGYGLGAPGFGVASNAWGVGLGALAGYGIGAATGALYNPIPTWSSYGLSTWGLGSWANNWLYSGYTNPYYSAPVVNSTTVVGAAAPAVAVSFDYNRPIDVTAAAPEPAIADQGRSIFNAARDSFKAGDFARALSLADQALQELPNDPALHEFRALCLFALRRYEEASVTLYAVLSAGPGWNWSTMIGLYPNAETYTDQLRALEASVNADPNSAANHFVLAYHYMVQGQAKPSLYQFQEVVRLKPNDTLSARFAKLLSPPPEAPQVASAATAAQPEAPPLLRAPAQVQADPATGLPASESGPSQATGSEPEPPTLVPPPANLLGNWTAKPAPDVSISLTLQEDGAFSWDFTAKGQTQSINGEAGYLDGVLTLAQPEGPPLVGKIENLQEKGFGFKPLDAPDAPVLAFSR